jgi:ribosomal protein S25
MNNLIQVSELNVDLAEGIKMRGASVVCSVDAKFDDIMQAMNTMVAFERVSQWCVGDLIIQGREILGEEFAQIESSLGYSMKTIKQYVYMSRAFPPEERTNLGYEFHSIVVGEDNDARQELLKVAMDNEMGANEFRKYVQAMRIDRGDPQSPKKQYVIGKVNVPFDMGNVYEVLADATNIQLTEDDLMALGMTGITNTDTVYVICLRKQEEEVPEADVSVVSTEDEPKARYSNMDEMIDEVVKAIKETKRASMAMIQRQLKVSAAIAKDVMEELEFRHIVGPPSKGNAREILIDIDEPFD